MTSAMTDLHQENKVYVLLHGVWGYLLISYSALFKKKKKKHSTGVTSWCSRFCYIIAFDILDSAVCFSLLFRIPLLTGVLDMELSKLRPPEVIPSTVNIHRALYIEVVESGGLESKLRAVGKVTASESRLTGLETIKCPDEEEHAETIS